MAGRAVLAAQYGSKSKKQKQSVLSVLAETVMPLVVPLAIGAFLLRRHLKARKSKPAQKPAAAPAAPAKIAVRRDVKVKRDRADVAAQIAEDNMRLLAEQQAAGLHGKAAAVDAGEDDEDGQGAAGGGQEQFFSMLQS